MTKLEVKKGKAGKIPTKEIRPLSRSVRGSRERRGFREKSEKS